MKRKETQQNGQTLTTFSYRRVPCEKTQLFEHKERLITKIFSRAERAIQLLTRCVALILAVVNYVYTHNMVITILLLGIAASALCTQKYN